MENTPNTELKGGLKSRHLTMMSIAGVIGAALFVGSGKQIALAGPAVILAYIGGGILVITEGVFGMAGDLGALDKIVELPFVIPEYDKK